MQKTDWGDAASDERNYTYDGIDKIIVKDDSGDSIESYVPGRSDFPGTAELTINIDKSNNGMYGYLFDEIGTTLGISNSNLNNICKLNNDSFGNQLSSTGLNPQVFIYRSKEYDSKLAQFNFYLRQYIPIICRWATKDISPKRKQYNAFINNPFSSVDILGSQEIPICIPFNKKPPMISLDIFNKYYPDIIIIESGRNEGVRAAGISDRRSL